MLTSRQSWQQEHAPGLAAAEPGVPQQSEGFSWREGCCKRHRPENVFDIHQHCRIVISIHAL
jgi:hypothetical protein